MHGKSLAPMLTLWALGISRMRLLLARRPASERPDLDCTTRTTGVARAHRIDPDHAGVGGHVPGCRRIESGGRCIHGSRDHVRGRHRLGAHRLHAFRAALDASPTTPSGPGRDGFGAWLARSGRLVVADPRSPHRTRTTTCSLGLAQRGRHRTADRHHGAPPSVRLFDGTAGFPSGCSLRRDGVPARSRICAPAGRWFSLPPHAYSSESARALIPPWSRPGSAK